MFSQRTVSQPAATWKYYSNSDVPINGSTGLLQSNLKADDNTEWSYCALWCSKRAGDNPLFHTIMGQGDGGPRGRISCCFLRVPLANAFRFVQLCKFRELMKNCHGVSVVCMFPRKSVSPQNRLHVSANERVADARSIVTQ